MDFSEVLTQVQQKRGKDARHVVEEAHALMVQAHKGQYRAGGDEFYTHPEAVACILVEQGHTDPELLAAALMHDVAEDTKTTLAEIQEQFGETITFLVDGVTDYGKGDGNEEIPDKYKRMEHTQKKILSFGQKDNRIFLIKVADRMHNLQTVSALPPEAQKRIIKQSQNFHSKLADEMGIDEFTEQLDDLLNE